MYKAANKAYKCVHSRGQVIQILMGIANLAQGHRKESRSVSRHFEALWQPVSGKARTFLLFLTSFI